MKTPITDTTLTGLRQLPTIASRTAEEMVGRLRAAEIAMEEAQANVHQALCAIADEITEEGDGWSFDEIRKTDLRGNPVMMSYLRDKGLDA